MLGRGMCRRDWRAGHVQGLLHRLELNIERVAACVQSRIFRLNPCAKIWLFPVIGNTGT